MLQALAIATSTSWMYIELLFGLVVLTLAIELVTKPKALTSAIEIAGRMIGGKLGEAIGAIELPTPVYMAYRLGLFTTIPAFGKRVNASVRSSVAAVRAHLVVEPAARPQVNH